MGLMGYVDGAPPGFIAVSVPLADDGSFHAIIPDLLHDRTIPRIQGALRSAAANAHAVDAPRPAGAGWFLLMLSEKGTGNSQYDLKLAGAPNSVDILPLQASYNDLHLRVVNRR